MRNVSIALVSVLAVALCVGPAQAAMTDKEKAELATAVSGAKVTLEQGLMVSKKNGKPVSAKFEIENGKPQLSIYIVKDGSKYSEVIVDHTSGEIAKAEPITGGDDLTEAKNSMTVCSGPRVRLGKLSKKRSTTIPATWRLAYGRR